jgi:antibiotic biosynthesis monooxygenase (ABM) superfamily enzyme
MNRRTYLTGMLAIAGGQAAKTQAPKAKRPIQLHLDLLVDPKREQEMLTNFEKTFRPTAQRQPGFIDLKMLKLNSAIRGPAPAGGKYRFVLTFESEDLRQKWIASKDHDKVWPEIEKTLTDKNFGILLYDVY